MNLTHYTINIANRTYIAQQLSVFCLNANAFFHLKLSIFSDKLKIMRLKKIPATNNETNLVEAE